APRQSGARITLSVVLTRLHACHDQPPNHERPFRAARLSSRGEALDSLSDRGFAEIAQCGIAGLPQGRLRQVDSGRAARRGKGQSNRLDTDSSAAVRPIASPISVAIESTRMLAATRTASEAWIESVITSSLRRDAVVRATAPPESTPWEM